MKQWSILLVFLSLSLSLSAQQGYEKDVFVSSTGDSLPYRMIRPESMKAGKKYPLVLFLHGAGERGNDNERQLTHGGQMFLNPVNREKYPAQVVVFVIAEALTYLTMAIMCSILAVQILWYYWVLAFIVGVLVTYGAIFGYDNLYSQIGTAVMNFIQALFNRKEG